MYIISIFGNRQALQLSTHSLLNFYQDRNGASYAEVILLFALVSLGTISALLIFQESFHGLLKFVTDRINSAATSAT